MNKYNFQVGDYCRHANGAIAIVAKVEKDRGFACRIGNSAYLWSYNNRFEPIPLTAEILKANGFEVEDNLSSVTFWLGKDDGEGNSDTLIEFEYDTEYECYILEIGKTSTTFNYVHELQCALRLCGLNELADNFKV